MSKDKGPIRKGVPFRPSAIESHILKGMADSRSLYRKDIKFYASDSADCPRKAVKFFHTKRRESITPASTAYMTLGIIMHEMITDALYKSNRLIFKEYRMPPRERPDIRGMVDAVFFAAEDKIKGMEIKSCGNLPGKPREAHELQALTYSALTGLEFEILYVSRKVAGYDGKLMLKSFEIECDEEAMTRTIARICLAYYANKKEVLPEISPTRKEGDCRFCGFRDECWEGEEEDLSTASTGQMLKLLDKADERAEEIMTERESRRRGIIKHIQRNATPDVQRKLESIGWS